MSIEELLKYSADQLEAMSDKEVKEFFAPYLKFITPEEKKEEGQKSMDLNVSSSPKRRYGGKSEIEKTLDLADRLSKMLNINQKST